MNNRISQYISLVVLMMITLACDTEKLLEKSPITRLSGDSYNSEANIEAAMYAVYDVLQWQSMGGQHVFPLMFQGIRADDMHSQFAEHWAAGLKLDDFRKIKPDNISVELLWRKWYAGVNRANLVIEKASEFNGWETKDMQKQLIAEAKTMRAFFYFELVRMFGGVPLIVSPIESTNDLPDLSRATSEQIYAQIDQDLLDAMSDLPLRSESVLGRATSGLAQTLLAKSKLYQEDYNAAAEYAEDVISSDEYDLEPVFADNFSEDEIKENGVESILEIQYADGFNGLYFEQANEAAQGSASWQMMFTWVSGRYTSFSNMLPKGDLTALYDQVNDQRYDATFITVGSDINAISPKLAKEWGLNDCCGGILDAPRMSWLRPNIEDCNYAKKYFISWELVDQLLEKSQSPKNEKIIRFAEVLLMHAEARLMGGAGAIDGQTSFDRVTQRAGIGSLPLTLDNLKLERRKELATEGWNRFSDLVRWGDAASNAILDSKNFTPGRDELLPIPQAEIEAIGANILAQNPGY